MKVRFNKTRRLLPGNHFEFFRNNKEAFLKLKKGEVVDIPVEVYEVLKTHGVVPADGQPEPKVEPIREVASFADDGEEEPKKSYGRKKKSERP